MRKAIAVIGLVLASTLLAGCGGTDADQVARLEGKVTSLEGSVKAERDKTIAAQDALAAMKSDAASHEAKLTARRANLHSRESDLHARETDLDSRESDLDGREAKLAEREAAATVPPAQSDATQEDLPSATDPGDDGTDEAFDEQWAVEKAGDVIEDIRTVDKRLGDGIAVSSALLLLRDSYGRLDDAGTPPDVDAAKYHARLTTLEQFAGTAADMYDVDRVQGHARYAVLRKETGVLFGQLNSSVGTNLRLP